MFLRILRPMSSRKSVFHRREPAGIATLTSAQTLHVWGVIEYPDRVRVRETSFYNPCSRRFGPEPFLPPTSTKIILKSFCSDRGMLCSKNYIPSTFPEFSHFQGCPEMILYQHQGRVKAKRTLLGCHFSRDAFLGIFRFLDFKRLPLQTCSEFGGAVLFFDVNISACLLAFECAISRPISLWGLNLRVLGFREEQLPCSRRSLDVAQKKSGQKPESNVRKGTSAELGVCSLPVWVSAYWGRSSKGRHGSGGLFGGFLQWIFWSQNAEEKPVKKSTRNSTSRKHKIRRRTTPPKSANQAQKSAAKPTNKSACQTSKCTVFFDWAGLLLEASSEHGFWDTLWLPSGHGRGSHAEMHLQSFGCCWWEGQGLLRTLPENTFSENLVKTFVLRNGPKKKTRNRHATLPILAAQEHYFSQGNWSETPKWR